MGKHHFTFQLGSEECELLLLFESHQNLQAVARVMGRDHSVVARALKKIADQFPVVEKKAGKWVLTATGRALNEGTRAAIKIQNASLNTKQTLRIGTNREFASRVLGADFLNFQKLFPGVELYIYAYQSGTEAALLQGKIDIGIDCERPHDPDIAYKQIVEERIVAVASSSFVKRQKKEGKIGLQEWPHLFCERLNPNKILENRENHTKIVARFNDIATTRAACVQGVGWALLPYYAIRNELADEKLILIDKLVYGKSKYGVWWLRNRPYVKDSCELIGTWLAFQELSL